MPDGPYQEELTFSKTCKILLFKGKGYKIPVSIKLESSPKLPNICFFDSVTGSDLAQVDVLYPSWVDYIRQRDMTKFWSASGIKPIAFETITLHLRLCEPHTCINFDVVDKLAALVLLVTTFVDRFIKSVHPT